MSTRRNRDRSGITQAQIAKELGISPAALTKLKAQGCPVHSVDAASTWRSRNLNPARAKPDPRRAREHASPAASLERPPALSTNIEPQGADRSHLERLTPLLAEGLTALKSGSFDHVEKTLREALSAVPRALRTEVCMPISLWDALVGAEAMKAFSGEDVEEAHHVESASAGGCAHLPPAADPAAGRAIPQITWDDVDQILYGLAAGELVFQAGASSG